MDRERIKGAIQTIKGRIEQAFGSLTGSTKLKTDGVIDEASGSVRTAVGEAKDAVRKVEKDSLT